MTAATSLPACPSWCTWPAGHPYTDDAADGSYVARYHEGAEDPGDVLPETPPMSYSGIKQSAISISISCEEQAVSDSGPALTARPLITLWTENPVMTAAESRQVAALLVRAAERLDDVLGDQP